MSLADYIAVHGEPTPVKTTYHRCHLCQAVILFTRSRLTTHLSKHKVTVRDYGNSYLSRVRSEKANVLVRKGLLTEPTRCLNKIPKQIKIKSVGPRSMKKRTLAAAAPPSRTRSRMSSTVERSAGAVTVKTEVEDQSDLSEEDNHPPAVSTFYTDSDTASQESNKRRKRFPSEKLSKLKISHVSSLATESHQQVKVKIEKETSGSGTTVLPPSRS